MAMTATTAFSRATLAVAALALVGCGGSGSKASTDTTTTQPTIDIGTCLDNTNPNPAVVPCTDKTAAFRIARHKILDCPPGMSTVHVFAGGSGTWCVEPITQ